MNVRCRLCGRIISYNVAYFNRPHLCYRDCKPPFTRRTAETYGYENLDGYLINTYNT